MKKFKGDAFLRGAPKLTKADQEYMQSYDPRADRRMYGPKAVGMFATKDDPQVVVKNAQLEGDEI